MRLRAPAWMVHGLVLAVGGFWIVLSAGAGAFTLGTPKVLSQPGQPILAEIPLRISDADLAQLDAVQITTPSKAIYERLGIPSSILELEPQLRLDRRDGNRTFIVLETVKPVSTAQINQDPFIDLMVALQWPSGQLTKNYTLLLGDPSKVIVRPGQTLSEIAAQMAPLLDGASLDQTMMALYKANPDAFAGGSIHRLPAGVELVKPSQSLMQSITPAQATQFVDKANQAWADSHGSAANTVATKSSEIAKTASDPSAAKDRLTIGPGTDANSDQRRYTEEIVAQEKMLEQTRMRIVELEKNITDLQKLLDAGKTKSQPASATNVDSTDKTWAPAVLAVAVIALTGLLLWFMARHARQSEQNTSMPSATITQAPAHIDTSVASLPADILDRTKNLFAGIDLELTPVKSDLALRNDALRVKLNLAKAYITIEDFAAAKRSLDDIIELSLDSANAVDLTTVTEAKTLLLQINQRTA